MPTTPGSRCAIIVAVTVDLIEEKETNTAARASGSG